MFYYYSPYEELNNKYSKIETHQQEPPTQNTLNFGVLLLLFLYPYLQPTKKIKKQ